MLQLLNNRFSNTYSSSYYYANTAERLDCGDTSGVRLQNHTIYFRGPTPLYHADLPLHMNRIPFVRKYFCFDETAEGQREEVMNGIKNKLLNLFNETSDIQYTIITGYLAGDTLENDEYEYAFIDRDIWKEFKDDAIKSLFNKCAEQTSLRETERQGRSIHQHIRIFKSKVKHMILILTDYADIDQESESFLALGLAPIFFEDYKAKLNELELEYFKTLVNRSQVKRISNVKATNCFNALNSIEKYHDLEREIRYQSLFKRVAEARIRNVESQLTSCRSRADDAMRIYDESLAKIHNYEILINSFKEGTNSIIEELTTISKMKGVYDLNTNGSDGLNITFRIPLDYFDADEAECAIRNVNNQNVVRFINDVFIEQKFKLMIRVDAFYSYSPNDSFRDFSCISEDRCKEINAMFNPHFQFYHCLGDYKPTLIKAMREQDLTLFVNVALAAARSMNFKDGAVCNRWFNWLAVAFDGNDYYLTMKCLEKDGKLYSLYQWLNNEFDDAEEPEVNVIEPEDL